MSKKRRKPTVGDLSIRPVQKAIPKAIAPEELERLPVTYQEIHDYFSQSPKANPFSLRCETFKRIENLTGTPLVCYITKTT